MITSAAVLKAPFDVQLRPVELPELPPPGWARIRVEACGVCGSDLLAATSAAEFKPIGHEIAGVVEALTPETTPHVDVGQAVALESGSFCGRCDLCRDGRVDLCNKTPGFWGQPAMGFSRWMQAPIHCLVPYQGLTAEVACLAEPVGVAVDMVRTAQIQLGQRVCLVGPGPIGLAAGALALRTGAASLTVISRPGADARLALARSMGGEVVELESLADLPGDLRRRFDHVLMTAPVEEIPAALDLLGYGGIMTFIGMGHGDRRVCFDGDGFHMRKLQLRASFASPAVYLPTALRMLACGAVPGEAMISHRFGLRQTGEALRTARFDRASAIKVVVTPQVD